MVDIVPPNVRSRMMAGIKGKNTRPEIMLRKGLHARGFRYLLHARKLPGKPDLVFPRYRAIIFAHGCFWHGHDCSLFKWPKSREQFWRSKIRKTRQRDHSILAALQDSDWRVGEVWECALKGRGKRDLCDVLDACERWLHSDQPRLEIRG